MVNRLHVRRYRNDERRSFLFPHGSDRQNIHRLAKRVIVADGLILLFIPYGQKGTVSAGMVSQFMTGHPCVDVRGHLRNPPVKVEDLMIIFPYNKHSGSGHRI